MSHDPNAGPRAALTFLGMSGGFLILVLTVAILVPLICCCGLSLSILFAPAGPQ